VHEIALNWTWGMKHLFQRFALRAERSFEQEEVWHLWPFMQPKVNNRDIDVSALWDPKTTNSKFIDTVFEKDETGFETQGACSTLCSVTSKGTEDGGEPLEAMTNGASSSVHHNDLEFKNLSAKECTLADIDKCCLAVVVSPVADFHGSPRLELFLTHSTHAGVQKRRAHRVQRRKRRKIESADDTWKNRRLHFGAL
jgi:hypothetical protein